MINVAYIAMAPFISGSERCLQLILSNCQATGINPILITPKDSPMRVWAQKNKIRHYSCDLSPLEVNFWSWCLTQLKLVRIFTKHKVQVAHSNQIWSFRVLINVCRLLNIKTICHFRDPIDNGSHWWLPKKPDVSICISEHIRKQYETTLGTQQQTKLVTTIDPANFPTNSLQKPQVISTAKTKAKEKFGFKSDTFHFGFVGQIAPVKGVLELIDTVSQLAGKDWQLIIAGKDPSKTQSYLQSCEARVTELGLQAQIKFIGFVENTNDFYQAVDVVTVFSLDEPLGLIPLEAAVNYTPTIASNVGGLPETIIDGQTGWLVDISKTADILTIMQKVMINNLTPYGVNARRWVESVSLPEAHCRTLKALCVE